jgi:hypothetical protein
MAHWNDAEKAWALAYAQKYSGHAVHKLSNAQAKVLLDKLVKDIAALASDLSKPKTRRAVQDYLLLLRKDPAKLETFMNKGRERSVAKNAANNAANNAVNNALTSLKKREASAEFWEQQAGDGLVRAREEVRSFHSVLLRHMLLLTANLLCSWPHLCIRISARTLSKES